MSGTIIAILRFNPIGAATKRDGVCAYCGYHRSVLREDVNMMADRVQAHGLDSVLPVYAHSQCITHSDSDNAVIRRMWMDEDDGSGND